MIAENMATQPMQKSSKVLGRYYKALSKLLPTHCNQQEFIG